MITTSRKLISFGIVIAMLLLGAIWTVTSLAENSHSPEIKEERENMRSKMHKKMKEKMKEKLKREIQDKMSGMPKAALDAQSLEPVKMPSVEEASKIALRVAAETAEPLIDRQFHAKGKKIIVPDNYKSIQQAINAAKPGDTVMVKAGTYYEQLIMKDGVKLISDGADHGDELTAVEGARLQLPRRTLRTIIDGSKATDTKRGVIDFNPDTTRKAIIDGFTVQNLPPQNHHLPGHAHGLNVRGASPVIMNCLIRNMGSTGIGSHVIFRDQEHPMKFRDFRYQNIKHFTSALIYNNVVHGSLGLGIGCNHFSNPIIAGNEVFNNSDASLGEEPSPGIGNKHGSSSTIIGNLVHDNPGGGILAQDGEPQGQYDIDRPTHPTIAQNVIFDNSADKPALSGRNVGSEKTPVVISGNFVYRPGSTGIGLSNGSVGIIEENMVADGKEPGIAVNKSTALKLNRNKVTGIQKSPGIIVVNHGLVKEMIGNAVDSTHETPRFLVDKESTVQAAASRGK